MSSINESGSAVDFNDIQGLIRFGYGPLTEACFLLLNIRNAQSARAWLAGAPVSNAVELSQPPQTALQLAFTREGLHALGLAEDILAGFSAEFLSGMTEPSRSRRLGDVAANAPALWEWGAAGRVPHVVAMLYAQPGQLPAWKQAIKGAQWNAAFDELQCLPTSNLYGVEPFGFTDGVSQPSVDWMHHRNPKGDQLAYSNLLTLGEFLLGYENEYGKYTERPLLAPELPASSILPFAEDAPDMRDLGRNGTYVVLRQLKQDVRGFWRFLDTQAGPNAEARKSLAESMVGRKMNGDPLLPAAGDLIPGLDRKTAAQNNFNYDDDASGTRCPFGAHIRRSNPRNADLPPGSSELLGRLLHTLGFDNPAVRDDVIASSRFHRLLRRGREYGPGLSPEEAIADAPDTEEHGIHFLCIGASLSRQFEFVQNAWIMSTKFDALAEESDPLLGNRVAIQGCPFSNTFSMPQESSVCARVMDVPQFITVRGGAYFFMPSLSALRYLAAMEPR
jgi:deferrochelatase/peroxidase EfeB